MELMRMETEKRRRGFDPEDTRWFSERELERMHSAQLEMRYLLDRGYRIEPVIDFIGNHYQFSRRQRSALQRATSSLSQQTKRISSRLQPDSIGEGPIEIDGFNLLITLETALSGSPILACDDGVLRDLAGLHGTYSLIGSTDIALRLIFSTLSRLSAPKVTVFLDAPVSNSGILRKRILDRAQTWDFPVEVLLVPDADKALYGHERIVTGDSVLLDNCVSWFNLTERIIRQDIENAWIVALDGSQDCTASF